MLSKTNFRIPLCHRAANPFPDVIAIQHATAKPFSKIFAPAYFLLLINPKVHYWKTLGFDTFKIRYYASEKVNRYLCASSKQKNIAHQTLACAQFFSQNEIISQKNMDVSEQKKHPGPCISSRNKNIAL